MRWFEVCCLKRSSDKVDKEQGSGLCSLVTFSALNPINSISAFKRLFAICNISLSRIVANQNLEIG
jgi:hypothetical protein